MIFSFPEGATPIDDITGLKIPWVQTLEDLSQVEAENIATATSKYLLGSVSQPQNWFNRRFLQKVHQEMFCDVWDWAGSFRHTQTIPGIEAYRISGALETLCLDVKYWCEEGAGMGQIEQAARIHHRLVYIHPYPNGNGRFSRLVADRYLRALNCSFPNWPIDLEKEGRARKAYIIALKKADQGDYKPLVEYMETYGAKEGL